MKGNDRRKYDLVRSLYPYFDKEERAEILEDFDEYLGMAPRDAALETPRQVLQSALTERGRSAPRKKVLLAWGLTALLFLLGPLVRRITTYDFDAQMLTLVLQVVGLPPALWMALGVGELARYSRWNPGLDRPKMWLIALGLALCLPPALLLPAGSSIVSWANAYGATGQVGTIFHSFLSLWWMAAGLLTLFCLLLTVRASVRYFCLVPQLLGLWAFFRAIYVYLSHMDSGRSLPFERVLLHSGLFFLLGCGLSLLTALLLNHLIRKGTEPWTDR